MNLCYPSAPSASMPLAIAATWSCDRGPLGNVSASGCQEQVSNLAKAGNGVVVTRRKTDGPDELPLASTSIRSHGIINRPCLVDRQGGRDRRFGSGAATGMESLVRVGGCGAGRFSLGLGIVVVRVQERTLLRDGDILIGIVQVVIMAVGPV